MKRLSTSRRLGILMVCLFTLLISSSVTTAMANVGKFTEYGIPTNNSGASGITAGPDGKLVGRWGSSDQLGILKQLGYAPAK